MKILKKIEKAYLFVFGCLLFNISCNNVDKPNILETPLDLSNDILDEKIIVDITNSLVELNEMMVNKRVDQKSYEQSVKKNT